MCDRRNCHFQAKSGSCSAFTLTEVLVSLSLAGITVGAIVSGYILSTRRAEWSSYSLAAHSLAMQRAEQARACKWDPEGWPAVDELVATNFATRIEVLDIPVSGTNLVYATNIVTITSISTNPPLKMIRVDCTWKFLGRGPYTNTVVTYRAADQ